MADASNAAGKGHGIHGPRVPERSGSSATFADGAAWPGAKPAVVKRAEDELMGPTAAVLARGNANDAHVESSQGKTSGQVKRAEAGKETKAKRNG